MFLPIKLHKISTNKIILAILALLTTIIVILTPLISHSITVQQIPNPRQVNGGWVSDQANILSAETEAQLNKLLWQLKTNTGAEFAVVTVPNTSSASSPKEFATELFNYWGIGEQGKDNGLLWLHSVGDRRLEIETGYGLEGILPDSRIGNIIRNEIIPKFKAGDFNGGTLTGVQSLTKIINRELEASLPGEVTTSSRQTSNGLPSDNSLQGEYVILFGVGAFFSAIAYIYAQTLAKKPVYVSSISIAEIQSSNLNNLLNLSNTEKNLGINFLLWLVSFILLMLMFGLMSLITSDTLDLLNVFFIIIFLAVLAWLLIKPLTTLIDQNPRSHSLHPIHCEKCRQPMVKLSDQEVHKILNKHQKTAIKLGAVAFEGWQCEKCMDSFSTIDLPHENSYEKITKTQKQKSQESFFHVRRYELNSRWRMCPLGKELTMKTSSRVTIPATQYSTGLKIVTEVCQCCDYHNEEHQILPALPTPSSSSSSDYSSNDSGGGYSGGSSGGGGDFGGGSSGGGGAGDSY
jgi:uncharacterized protein